MDKPMREYTSDNISHTVVGCQRSFILLCIYYTPRGCVLLNLHNVLAGLNMHTHNIIFSHVVLVLTC